MTRPGDTTSTPQDPIHLLRDEFRGHLETFYAQLKLAPPYHSVEKAILRLTTTLKALPASERARIANESALRWAQYQSAFVVSGLNLKHRGIIAGLARSRQKVNLPKEYDNFLSTFLT